MTAQIRHWYTYRQLHELVERQLYIFMLDGSHRRRSVEMTRDEYDVKRAVGPLHMGYTI